MQLHHIGYVVDNLESHFNSFPELSLQKKIIDPSQNAEIMLCKNQKSPISIEFIKPLNEKSFTWNFLKNGGGLHHICYDSLSLIQIEEVIAKYKMLKIRGPMHAVLFDKEVIFVITKTKQIIEFIVCEE